MSGNPNATAPELTGNAKEAWELYSRLSEQDQERVLRYIDLLLICDKNPTPEAQRINDEMQRKIREGSFAWGELDSYLDALSEALTAGEGIA